LSYIKEFGNPDFPEGAENVSPDGSFPPGSSAEQSFREASEATAQVMQLAVQGIPRKDLRRVFGWENDGFFNFRQLAREIFDADEDISLWELFKYYRLHKQYSQPYTDLVEVQAKKYPWDPSVVLNSAYPMLLNLQ
jgi:hypothetical protein